jgi:hypothetical protein
MHDLAIRTRHAHDFGGAKNTFVKIHGPASVFTRERWRNRVIPLGDSADSIWHNGLLIVLDVRALETGSETVTGTVRVPD